MEAAKAAVNKITGKTGHKTDVDETVNPAVTSETVKPHRHEEVTEAVNREVHQDHYHTTIQPVSHKERLPEKHTHNLAPQVEREFRHGDDREVQQGVNAELGQFQDTTRTGQTTTSSAAAPAVAGEHVHHHVHETVQPVIHKETVQPEVVHTTVPIHEVETAAAQHHSMSALPTKTLGEFERAGGTLTGGQRTTHEEYDGRPRPYNEELTANVDKALPGSHHHHHHHHNQHAGNTTGVGSNVGGTTGTGIGSTTSQGGLGSTGRDTVGSSTHGGLGNTSGDRYDNTTSGGLGDRTEGGLSSTGTRYDDTTSGTAGRVAQEEGKSGKPSLLDRLNPRKDTDGDGKAGLMD